MNYRFASSVLGSEWIKVLGLLTRQMTCHDTQHRIDACVLGA
uniref:Uncharacterized protein n=1 Tax=Rhizophora mucronata TaxID=61149 RepID=A0A2P2NB35_RHIMU